MDGKNEVTREQKQGLQEQKQEPQEQKQGLQEQKQEPQTQKQGLQEQKPAQPVKRRLRYGSLSVAIMLCFIAAVILLNAVVAALGERYTLRFDLTKDQIFKLSSASEDYLAGLDKDVSIYVLTAEEYFARGNLYYVQAQDVLEQYAARSPRITLEYVDLPQNPGFENRFPQFQLSSYSIILESGEQAYAVNISDLFNTNFDQYSQSEYITSSEAEQVLTSAIMNVTSEQLSSAVVVEGFGESGAEALETVLSLNNYHPVRQNLLTGDLPAEADFAVICAPMRDYPEDALRKLDRFLQNEGHYGKSLLYFPSVNQQETPNLDAFLADWGIAADEGVVYQTDYDKLITLSHYWSVTEYTEEIYAKTAIERRLLSVVPNARPLRALFETRDDVAVSTLLTFTDSAVVAPIIPDESWTPETAERRGPVPALILASRTAYDRSQAKEVRANVLVFGSSEFISQSFLSSRMVGNLDFILNVFSVLSERPQAAYIAPKTIGAQELPVSGGHALVYGVVFIAVLPLAVLATGGVIFFRRRRR